jgi:ferredoxin
VTSHAVVVCAEVPAELLDLARAAVDGCPEGALSVTA